MPRPSQLAFFQTMSGPGPAILEAYCMAMPSTPKKIWNLHKLTIANTRGSVPLAFAFAMAASLSALFAAKFWRARAAFSFASSDPFRANCTKVSMPPAFAMATLLSAFIAKFWRAPAANSFASSDPFRANCTRGSMPPAFAMCDLVVSILHCQVPESPSCPLSFASSDPFRANCTRGSMPPAFAMATLLSALIAKFRRAPAAFSFASSDPFRANCTKGSMPPAFAMCHLVVSILHWQVPKSPQLHCTFPSSDPFRANCTRDSMPPAFAMCDLVVSIIRLPSTKEPQLLSPLLHLTHSGPTAPKARCRQPSRWVPVVVSIFCQVPGELQLRFSFPFIRAIPWPVE